MMTYLTTIINRDKPINSITLDAFHRIYLKLMLQRDCATTIKSKKHIIILYSIYII